MDDKLLIKLLKIIKQSKQIALDAFLTTTTKTSYIDFDTIFNDIDILLQDLSNAIEKESKTFNREYKDEQEMIDTILKSMLNISKPIKNLSNIYTEVKNTKKYNDEIQQILVLKVIEKILNTYLQWAERLELALMGTNTNEVIFSPNFDDEIKLINFIGENTHQDYSCWFPFLGGIGLGFLLDE